MKTEEGLAPVNCIVRWQGATPPARLQIWPAVSKGEVSRGETRPPPRLEQELTTVGDCVGCDDTPPVGVRAAPRPAIGGSMRVAEKIELKARTKRQLQSLLVREQAGSRVQQRARVILLAAQGWQNKAIALEVDLNRTQVAVWRQRFITGGVEALANDVSSAPRTLKLSSADESRILSATLNERPPTATHWSTRTLAARLGMKADTIEGFWRRHGLKPHLQRAFQLAPESRVDSHKVQVMGLFLHPAKMAVAFSCDEKGLGRKTTCKESGLPLQRGRALSMANYYKRNGTMPMFSALNSRSASLVPPAPPLADWLKFLQLIELKTPPGLRLYLIEDSSSDRPLGDLQEWLLSHTRLVMHSTTTRKSWLRIFELFYRELCERPLQPEVTNLEQAIKRYIANRKTVSRAIIWTRRRSVVSETIDNVQILVTDPDARSMATSGRGS